MIREPTAIWCMHGNLQLPTVWDEFKRKLALRNSEGDSISAVVNTENLWLGPVDCFSKWTNQFCKNIQSSLETSHYLLGYSLGGRLAFHAAIHAPDLFRGIIVVSADPGIADEAGRIKQLESDQKWGARFLSEPWDRLMSDWDNQSVFGGSGPAMSRNESDYSREEIASMFDVFSKGRQGNLIPELAELNGPPILYMSGIKDRKYCDIGQGLQQECSCITHTIIDDAGHRVPWDNPDGFVRAVQEFIVGIECG